MAEKKVKGRKTSARYPKGYTGPTDTDVVIERPPRKPPKPPRGPKATKGGGKGSVGSSNGKRPATPKGKKDPGGFVSPGFKSEGFRAGKRKTETGPPPSVRARDEKRAKQTPPVKYGGKKKPPRSTYKPSPFPGQPPRPRPKPRPTPKPGPRKPGSAKPRPGPRKPSKGRPKKPMGKGR